MRTVIRKSIIVALMLGTLNSYATGTTIVNNKSEISASLVNVKKGQHIYIKNAEGKVLHEEVIEKTGSLDKGFNFQSLQNGYYTLEINKDFQIEVRPFTVISGQATFYTKEEKTIFKPVVRTEGNKVMVSKLDFEAAPLQVTLYFDGEVILRETLKGEKVLKRVYNLRKDIKGKYKMVMKANDRIYINEFSL
ncbi:hypothetical protein [Pseudotenacibaculum haliotis]|uniref:Uncharacterized protein n=1 Tax=Pseudotenacibaculum haliotis TaxID=1862138 RepID=A0ABW5LTA4_9FLAO